MTATTTDTETETDRQMLTDSVRRFVERGYNAEHRNASIAHPHGCLPDVWQSFGEFGWLALSVPQVDGGMGASAADTCAVAEELGRGAINEPFLACAVLANSLLVSFAPDTVRSAWLPELMAGNRRIAFSSADDLKVTCIDGVYRVSGQTSFVAGGAGADGYLLTAEIDAGENSGVFLISANTPGVTIKPCTLYDGQRAAFLHLDDAKFDNVLWIGPPSQLRLSLRQIMDRVTVVHCAETVGAMQRAYDITLGYLKIRKQFGRAIASNQVIQHRLVDLLIQIEEARALTHAAALALDDSNGDATDSLRYAAAAKAYTAQAARHVWKETVQLHGAIGMTQEYELSQFVKRLAAASTLYGSEETHLERLAEISLGNVSNHR